MTPLNASGALAIKGSACDKLAEPLTLLVSIVLIPVFTLVSISLESKDLAFVLSCFVISSGGTALLCLTAISSLFFE